MVTKLIKLAIACSILILLLEQPLPPDSTDAQDVSQYDYAYVYQVPPRGGKVVIKTIDPANPTTSVRWYETIWPDDATSLYGAIASPNGEWIVLIPDGGQILRLIEVSTGQTRDITAIPILTHSIGRTILGQSQAIAWSPDSQLLAFTAFTTDGVDVFVYDLADQTLTNLSNDPVSQSAVAWSPDSNYLASGGIACDENDCQARIEIFDWITQARTVSQNIAPASLFSYEGTICHLRWSPDAQYLSFVSSCDMAMQGLEKELFLLDRVQGTVQQLTSLTQTAIQAPNAPVEYPLRWGIYDTAWVDGNTFFLGETFAQPGLNVISQIVRYNVSNGSQLLLRADVMAEEWTPHPTQNLFAFRTASGYPNGRIYHDVEIVNTADGMFTTTTTGPAGCHLTWIPNGTTLAYSGHNYPDDYPLENCYGPVSTLYFLDAANGQLSQYAVAETGEVRTAGWIKHY